jgi:hypothetical protein
MPDAAVRSLLVLDPREKPLTSALENAPDASGEPALS